MRVGRPKTDPRCLRAQLITHPVDHRDGARGRTVIHHPDRPAGKIGWWDLLFPCERVTAVQREGEPVDAYLLEVDQIRRRHEPGRTVQDIHIFAQMPVLVGETIIRRLKRYVLHTIAGQEREDGRPEPAEPARGVERGRADTDHPLLPAGLFSDPARVNAYAIRFVYSAAITAFWFFTPRFLQAVYHWTPLVVGVSFLPMTLVNFLAARQVGSFMRRFSQERILIVGLLIATAGFAGMLLMDGRQNGYWTSVALPMVLIGYGLVLSPVTNIAVDGLPETLGGIASGLINVMLQIGGVVGIAVLSVVSGLASSLANYRVQVIGITFMGAVAFLLSLGFLRGDRRRTALAG